MSHNVTLKGIKFKNLEVLGLAAAELIRDLPEANRYEFIGSKATSRGWNGRTTMVDAVIKCHGQPYDIGFRVNADGEYVPFMESGFCAPGLHTEHAAKTVEGAACGYGHAERALGRLQQRYALLTAERNAKMQGLGMTKRVLGNDGQIHLHVMQA